MNCNTLIQISALAEVSTEESPTEMHISKEQAITEVDTDMRSICLKLVPRVPHDRILRR